VIQRAHVIAPVGILFDRVARIDPADPHSAKAGLGRFQAELWVLTWAGVDFRGFSKPQLVATRFFFDALFPFVLLFLFSWATPPASKTVLDRFFARLHTPVQPSPAAEEAELAASYANPGRFERDKLFPGSQWEVMKPAWTDYLGFFGTWALVGVVIVLLYLMVTVQ